MLQNDTAFLQNETIYCLILILGGSTGNRTKSPREKFIMDSLGTESVYSRKVMAFQPQKAGLIAGEMFMKLTECEPTTGVCSTPASSGITGRGDTDENSSP